MQLTGEQVESAFVETAREQVNGQPFDWERAARHLNERIAVNLLGGSRFMLTRADHRDGRGSSMKQEWPLGKALEAGAEPLLPLPFPEVVAAVKSSGAIDAFARRRAGQIIHSGHTAESDLTKGIGQLASEAQWRLSALHEVVGRFRMNLPPARRADCLKYIEGAGAVLIALWDRCQVEVPDA